MIKENVIIEFSYFISSTKDQIKDNVVHVLVLSPAIR